MARNLDCVTQGLLFCFLSVSLGVPLSVCLSAQGGVVGYDGRGGDIYFSQKQALVDCDFIYLLLVMLSVSV